MDDATLPLPGLSPLGRTSIVARFDGGSLSSDAGVLVLREVEKRLGVADRLAGCLDDPRNPDLIVHGLADMIRFRMLMIAAGYEDGNDAAALRLDPVFKMAQGTLPSGRDLASQPTLSRLDNLPDPRALLRMGRAMVDLHCASFAKVPKRIVLDIEPAPGLDPGDTFDAVHGGQQLRLFNGHHDNYGFQPIVVFDGDGRFVAAVLRPAKRPSGIEIRGHLRRLLRTIRANWPKTDILIRGDSHYCGPLVIDWCRANGVDFIFGVAPSSTLRKHIETLEASTAERFNAAPGKGKVRRFKAFHDGAGSWSRVERIIARVEAGDQGTDTRFIVTNLSGGKPKVLYQDVYCRRGCAENHIKSWKTHLAADHTSCTKATANQFRLFLHAGACWLMWGGESKGPCPAKPERVANAGLRVSMPKRSMWRVAQFDTLRLRLIKIAPSTRHSTLLRRAEPLAPSARVVEMKTQVRLHLPTTCPTQAILRLVLGRIPRLAT